MPTGSRSTRGPSARRSAMNLLRRRWAGGLLGLLWVAAAPRWVQGQIVLSANETKIELTSGKPQAAAVPGDDSLTLLDFSQFPPRVRHTHGISNTVIGPPSNLAILPSGQRALLADSIQVDRTATPDPWVSRRSVFWLDISSDPIRILATLEVGRQPSGMSIDRQGQFALVANRADGSVSLIDLQHDPPRVLPPVEVCAAELGLSDIAIHPQGQLALASVQKGGYLAVLKITDKQVSVTAQKVSVCGQPYRVVVTPDGQLGLTAGQGFAQNGIDVDALSIVDLVAQPPRTLGYVGLGAVPESIEISPDGTWLAAVLMAGSNFPVGDPRHAEQGELVLLRREGRTFVEVQRVAIGRIPEGVAFTRDGRYLLAQCYPERQIWIFSVSTAGLLDTGVRIELPGMPAALRAAP